jgi:hypothetical protein
MVDPDVRYCLAVERAPTKKHILDPGTGKTNCGKSTDLAWTPNPDFPVCEECRGSS